MSPITDGEAIDEVMESITEDDHPGYSSDRLLVAVIGGGAILYQSVGRRASISCHRSSINISVGCRLDNKKYRHTTLYCTTHTD